MIRVTDVPGCNTEEGVPMLKIMRVFVAGVAVAGIATSWALAGQGYIEPFLMEDGIWLKSKAGSAYYEGRPEDAYELARQSMDLLLSCLPLATEPEKAEIYYFVGRDYLVLGDLDKAEEYFKKAAEIDFIAPEAYGGLLKIVDLRIALGAQKPQAGEEGTKPLYEMLRGDGPWPAVPQNTQARMQATKPIYEALRRVCPYNRGLLFPTLGGWLSVPSESAEASMKATGKIPDWLPQDFGPHFAAGAGAVFVEMCMWDEAIRCYQLGRYTELSFGPTKKPFDLPYLAETYDRIGDCYLAKRDIPHAILWYRMCLSSHTVHKIAYIRAYLRGEPMTISATIQQGVTGVRVPREYREAGADLPPMDRGMFFGSGIGAQDLSQPPAAPRPDPAKLAAAALGHVRNNMHEEAIRLYKLTEEVCGVSLKKQIAQAYESYADMLAEFRAKRDKYATLMGRNITYAVVADTYLQARGAYIEAGDQGSAARMAEKANQMLALNSKDGG